MSKQITAQLVTTCLRKATRLIFHAGQLLKGMDIIWMGGDEIHMQGIVGRCMEMVSKLLEQGIKLFCWILQHEIQVIISKVHQQPSLLSLRPWKTRERESRPDKMLQTQQSPCYIQRRRQDGGQRFGKPAILQMHYLPSQLTQPSLGSKYYFAWNAISTCHQWIGSMAG